MTLTVWCNAQNLLYFFNTSQKNLPLTNRNLIGYFPLFMEFMWFQSTSQSEYECVFYWWRDETQSCESSDVRKHGTSFSLPECVRDKPSPASPIPQESEGNSRPVLKLNEHIDLFPLWNGTGAHGNDMCQITRTHSFRVWRCWKHSRVVEDRLCICDGIR